MRRLIAVAVLCAGCHGPLDIVNDAMSEPNAPTWLGDPQLTARTTAAADVAAHAWGGSLASLDGWTVHLTAAQIPSCVGHPARMGYRGCTEPSSWGGGGTVTMRPEYAPCIEATVLAHEIGHVIIGDPSHSDPRWGDRAFWDIVREALLSQVKADDQCARTLSWPEWFYDLNMR